MIVEEEKGRDGGINPSRTIGQSDVCLNGMVLNFASYFKSDEEGLRSVVDFILDQRMHDGGFNCRLNRSGAVHSSLHSTLSVAEGKGNKRGMSFRVFSRVSRAPFWCGVAGLCVLCASSAAFAVK